MQATKKNLKSFFSRLFVFSLQRSATSWWYTIHNQIDILQQSNHVWNIPPFVNSLNQCWYNNNERKALFLHPREKKENYYLLAFKAKPFKMLMPAIRKNHHLILHVYLWWLGACGEKKACMWITIKDKYPLPWANDLL